MKKNLVRVFVLSLCLVLLLSLTACHRANERALYINDEGFSAGYYSCALVFADIEGQQKVYDTLGEKAAGDYLNQTLDGVDYKTWVKNRAIEKCKEAYAYRSVCEELMIDTEKHSQEYLETADYYWDYSGYSEMMMENGVGRGTFRSFIGIDAYKASYFDYIYGEGGIKEIPAEEIITNLTENYVIANVLSEDLTAKSEEEIKQIKEKLEGYAERIRNGEKFEKIYSEFNGTTYTENTENKSVFSYDLASVIGNEKTTFTDDNFNDVSAMKNGDIQIIEKVTEKGTENEKTTLYLFFKSDILAEENTLLPDLKDAVRHSLKDEEFTSEMKAKMDMLTVKEMPKITKQFKVEKIKYPA